MRIGIIGTGWGLMHVGGFRGAGAEVVGLCGIHPEKTREIASREGIRLATVDPAKLVAVSDAIVVASPDAFHASHAALAMSAGKHVLVEKPLTRELAEAEALQVKDSALPAGQISAVNFPYRMLPPMLALWRWIRSRPPPEELHVSVRNSFLFGEGVGASGDLGGASHVIDAALWLMGSPPSWLQAAITGWSLGLHLGLKSGALITVSHRPAPEPGIDGQWSVRGSGWEAQLAGGYVPALGGWRIGPARGFENGQWFELSPRVEPIPGHREPWAQAHVETARAFLAAIRGEDRGSLARIEEGAVVQRILDAAARSAWQGQRLPIMAG